VKRAIATGSALLLTCAAAAAEPTPYLKGVAMIKYNRLIVPTEPCVVDWKAWDTAIEFVANQSAKLRLMSEHDHYQYTQELYDVRDKRLAKMRSDKNVGAWTDQDWQRYNDEIASLKDKVWVPSLSFHAHTIDLKNGCAAVIIAEVNAPLERSTIIGTGEVVPYPEHEVWSTSWTLKGPYQTFSKSAIEISEQIMKELANDWAKSQKLTD
jgi:hypothetical protein